MKNNYIDDDDAGFNKGMAAYENDEYETAIELLKPFAQKGNVIAANTLGDIYYNSSYPEDEIEAAKWFLKVAEQGHLDAQITLASMYHNGLPEGFVEGSGPCDEEAFKWCLKAAEQGDPESQDKLGCFYAYGLGTTKDNGKAVFWFLKVAEQGIAESKCSLGYHYAEGLGVEQNYKEAATWYRSAAERRIGTAQYSLGLMYSKGDGVPQNYVQAYILLTWAMGEDEDAAKSRDIVAKQMTPEQIEEAQRLASE